MYNHRAGRVRGKGSEADACWCRYLFRKLYLSTFSWKKKEEEFFCHPIFSIPLRSEFAPCELIPCRSGLWHLAPSGSLRGGHLPIQWLGSPFQSGHGSRASVVLSGQAQELWSGCIFHHCGGNQSYSELGSQKGAKAAGDGNSYDPGVSISGQGHRS